MAVPIILAACFIGVFCLAPLAVYLLWLASVHRKGHPVVLSGRGDLTALLIGLIGFLLAGAVVTLTAVQSGFRAWTRGNFVQVRANWGEEQSLWLRTMGSYFLVVLLAVGWSYYRRRKALVVYNVDLGRSDDAVGSAVAGAGRSATRIGHRWADSTGDILEARPFHAMRQLTVSVMAKDARLAEELDRQLRSSLTAAPAGGGLVGAWFSSAAWSCGLTAVCCLGLLLFYLYLAAGR